VVEAAVLATVDSFCQITWVQPIARYSRPTDQHIASGETYLPYAPRGCTTPHHLPFSVTTFYSASSFGVLSIIDSRNIHDVLNIKRLVHITFPARRPELPLSSRPLHYVPNTPKSLSCISDPLRHTITIEEPGATTPLVINAIPHKSL
jgi:hypothetical protein